MRSSIGSLARAVGKGSYRHVLVVCTVDWTVRGLWLDDAKVIKVVYSVQCVIHGCRSLVLCIEDVSCSGLA